ncbi:MAG: phosphoribosylanthranilate isomerase [Vampirovibrionales bacterium]|nr:phosphoribosylanthranilate isomerase [Vampirovibrionales bacterium]
MSIALKTCGITHIADAELCINHGAAFLGLIFVPDTPRYIADIEVAKAICQQARPLGIPTVGVFRDQPASLVFSIAEQAGLEFIQLHGQERAQDFAKSPYPIIKTLMLRDANWPLKHAIQDWQPLKPYAWLLEDASKQPEADFWQRVPHTLAQAAGLTINIDKGRNKDSSANTLRAQIWVAGGFTPQTMPPVVQSVWPWADAIDVASGIEVTAGQKSPEKLRAMIHALQL